MKTSPEEKSRISCACKNLIIDLVNLIIFELLLHLNPRMFLDEFLIKYLYYLYRYLSEFIRLIRILQLLDETKRLLLVQQERPSVREAFYDIAAEKQTLEGYKLSEQIDIN
ncbi:hypothetical protein H8356DRAFT_935705 [Neocallimastix lanati (nom. inval.)]|uniref:Uncharacterized protein n=1 Tax=Neocallimastix californiae TaxID=1754190 RepID=A0A1Y2BMR0_9FUNG|nr:hypothetical protein H8356DRAFT_970033 [Neocallimastix sp. JGI-2020a]KAG4099896.1 hypothetical protein H8356DRAFT_935705 [Neocallimastix sp. JGI-2020a]ORY36049.1 hypothetical protein LY90DRAFT_511692 [Neocallimastix californiae]|eukprot:ORY36049.1 hypothetical protein LY90DRAFT_511692 [Neocallimastix californiae]